MLHCMNDTPLLDPVFDTPESLAKILDAHPDFRVLRRLQPARQFGHKAPRDAVRRIAVLDTETTGLDARRDRIIELAMVLVDVDVSTGQAVKVVEVFDELEDPGMPIPEPAGRVTGITDEMVAGKRLDDEQVKGLLNGVHLVIAHNARFDRGFVEARFPFFAEVPWACSVSEVDWQAEGRGSAKLEFLASELGFFYDAHRAEMDCHALLAVLMAPLPLTGVTGLKALWDKAQRVSYRVMATGSPFESKDVLKERGYRWDAERKVWHTTVSDDDALTAECAWLKAQVYKGRAARVDVERVTALERHSPRGGDMTQQAI